MSAAHFGLTRARTTAISIMFGHIQYRFNEWLYRLGIRISDRDQLHGIEIFSSYKHPEARRRALEQIDTALGWIARYDPRRLARARRDLQGVLLWPSIATGARYDRRLGMCVLDMTRVLDEPVKWLTRAIVHESTHARLRCMPYDTPEQRVRVERVCIEAEIAFFERCPDGGSLLESLRRALVGLRPEDYTDEVLHRRMRTRERPA